MLRSWLAFFKLDQKLPHQTWTDSELNVKDNRVDFDVLVHSSTAGPYVTLVSLLRQSVVSGTRAAAAKLLVKMVGWDLVRMVGTVAVED